MDFIAAILEITAKWVVGNKNRWGFILHIICGCCWIAYSLANDVAYGLILAVVPMMFVNMRNFLKWTREE